MITISISKLNYYLLLSILLVFYALTYTQYIQLEHCADFFLVPGSSKTSFSKFLNFYVAIIFCFN